MSLKNWGLIKVRDCAIPSLGKEEVGVKLGVQVHEIRRAYKTLPAFALIASHTPPKGGN